MTHLTKSRFIAGRRCHDLLWWMVHEPEAEEFAPNVALEGLLEQGREVELAARGYVPGGVLIEAEGRSIEDRVRATAEALAGGARVLYEAAFMADEVFVSVDILERAAGSEPDSGSDTGFHLIEVKVSSGVKKEHMPDVAIQLHVLRRSGLEVDRAEVMHLNRECRYPDLEDLFVREDVTEAVEEFLPEVADEIEAQLSVLGGPFPKGGFGRHCLDEKDCRFHDRCWPEESSDSVLTLYRVRSDKKWELMADGIESIGDLATRSRELNKTAQRQVRSVLAGGRIHSRGLAEALEAQVPGFGARGRLAYLDFETVQRAIPVWDGCGPWAQMPVQFSCHRERKPGWPEHFEFLAESGADCREALAQALVAAVLGDGEVTGVVVYNAGFERMCLRGLAAAVPRLVGELEAIESRLVDLLPLVRDHVYDPQFLGSFSLKSVLPALLPDVNYDDLEVAEGSTASLYLSRLLFQSERIPEAEREPLRQKLLAYCKRDTWATVRLLEKLRALGALGADR